MKKKIAIMLSIILMAGTFTACTAEEKVNNDVKTSVVSKAADVSVSGESSEMATTEKATETTTTEKATVSKKTEPSGRIPKPKKKPTVGKIRRLFRQRIRFKKHKQKFRTTEGIQ